MKQTRQFLLRIQTIFSVPGNHAFILLLSLITTGWCAAQPAWITGYPAVVSGASSADITAQLSQAGTAYYVVYNALPSGVTAAKIKSDALATPGGSIVRAGSIAVSLANTGYTALLTGMPSNTTYYFYLVAESSSGLQPDASVKSFTKVFPKRQMENSYTSQYGPNAFIGYLAYVPEAYYKNPTQSFPVLIFLHGQGEKVWNSRDLSQISLVKDAGPPMLIEQGQEFPFIVISPQCPFADWDNLSMDNFATSGQFMPGALTDEVLETMKTRYRIDANRVYITGLSMGGGGAWSYTEYYPQKVAASIPISGWNDQTKACAIASNKVAVWAFHGQSDGTVNPSGDMNMIPAINACNPAPQPPAKLTLYPGVGHDAWTQTYNNTGPGIAPDNIYNWLMRYSKNGTVNNTPVANAGPDKTIVLPANSATLNGTGTDTDGAIASYAWTKQSGPSVTLNGANTATLSLSGLVAGTYVFRLTVTDNLGATAYDEATVTVSPQSGSGDGLGAQYYNSMTVNGTIINRVDGTVNFVWDGVAPIAGTGANYYSVRWLGKVQPLYSETYTFYTISDDGVRLWVNGTLLIDNWTNGGPTENSGTITLTAGQKYDIRMEYYQLWGGATAQLQWASTSQVRQVIPQSQLYSALTPAGNGDGLQGAYYNSANHTGTMITRTDNTINMDWASGGPLSGIGADNFSIRWTGRVEPRYSETYTFYTVADDGVRLWVNGKLLVNDWNNHPATQNSGTITLAAGQKYEIVMEYYDGGYLASAQLSWSSPSEPKQVIPQSQLYSSDFPGSYSMMARHSSKVMDVWGASANENAAIVQYPSNGGYNQQWLILNAGEGLYKFVARHSGKVINILNGGLDNGYNIEQLSDNGSYAQKFSIEPVGSGYYKITNAASGKAVAVYGASMDDGAYIGQWDYVNSACYHWQFLPLAVPPAGQSVTSLTLYDAGARTAIAVLTPGYVLNLANYPSGTTFTFVADNNPTIVGSVKFDWDGAPFKTVDSIPPYSFTDVCWRGHDCYNAWWRPSLGTHTIKATPYTLKQAQGTAGTPLSITFQVVNGARLGNTSDTPSGTVVNYNNENALIDFTGHEGNVHIALFDISGRSYYEAEQLVDDAHPTVEINMQQLNLERGLYFIKAESAGSIRTFKIAKN